MKVPFLQAPLHDLNSEGHVLASDILQDHLDRKETLGVKENLGSWTEGEMGCPGPTGATGPPGQDAF